MGLVKNWASGEIVFELQGWEEQLLSKRIRTKVNGKCWNCGTKIPKSSFAYGKAHYSRVCIKCWENVIIIKVEEGMARIYDMIHKEQRDLDKNRKKIEQVNMLANLQ